MSRVNTRYRWYKHCDILADVLQKVADGEIKRLMVFEPPRHGKSEQISRLFPAYFLSLYPHRWVSVNSYGADLAEGLSRSARDYYIEGGGTVRRDASGVRHWETGQGGGLFAAGVGGPITGKGFHLGIIDDPLKNAQEAESQTIRDGQKDWYGSTFYTREEPWSEDDPNGAIVITATLWNEDDLPDWLLAQETAEDDEAEHWHIVYLPAIAEETPRTFPETCTVEPDWRQPGEALCPERRPLSKLKKIAARIGNYFFGALFQQNPKPREGGMFKRAWFEKRLTVLPQTQSRNGEIVPVVWELVRYWDKAGTEGGGAYTVGALIGRSDEVPLRYAVCDIVRGQYSEAERERTILQTARRDHSAYGEVATWVEQEPGSGGKEAAERTVRMLNAEGFACQKEPVTGDKVTRARPLAAACGNGDVWLIEGHWNTRYVEEMTGFPNGTYKDQTDASSGGFNKLSLAANVEFF